ncbi:MAG: hypothetical protein APF81_12605 [Desulfosporosinus sp. BRH_c37]|nr:MAG: hypothetical protein APF81_12605 [Desulfosporosinus sp. BRH_c37]
MRKVLWTLLLITLLVTAGCSKKSTSNVKTNPPQPSQESSEVPSAPQTQSDIVISPQMSLSWVDLKEDILNPKGLTTDGKPDGHFLATMGFAEASKIKYIIMRYTEYGEHVQWAWDYNKNVPIVGSPMAVFVNNALVLQGTDLGLASSGNTGLDLYIPELNNENGRDTFKFANGQTISIQIKYITISGVEKEFNTTTVVNM